MKNISKVKQAIQTFWKIYKDNDDPNLCKWIMPEEIARARREFNVDILPRMIPGVNDFSPHHDRRWKWSGKDYIARMHAYERMVTK